VNIIFVGPEERGSGRDALEVLMRDAEFLSDAWNQDFWIALAAEAFAVSVSTATEALRLDTTGKNRIKATMRFLAEKADKK